MDERFCWHAEYETGDPEIDRDHLQAFEFANILWTAVERGLGSQVVERALDAFVGHLAEHIGREEAALARLASPLFQAQKEAHAKMLAQLSRLRSRMGKNDGALSGDFAAWVENSLVPHIYFDDFEAFRAPRQSSDEAQGILLKTGGTP